jgi:hypothetical protein
VGRNRLDKDASLALFLFQKSKPSLYYPGRQYSRSPAAIVPPPSPEHHLEQLSPEAIPLWAQVGMLPQDLLEEW